MKKNKSIRIVYLILCVFFSGCMSNSSAAQEPFEIDIQTKAFSNQGLPFYCVVKEVEKGEFLTDTYQEVAEEVFSGEEDPSKRTLEVIIPGSSYRTRFQKSKKNTSLGIYFLFTNPGEEWKLFVDPSCKKINIELGEDEIKSIK